MDDMLLGIVLERLRKYPLADEAADLLLVAFESEESLSAQLSGEAAGRPSADPADLELGAVASRAGVSQSRYIAYGLSAGSPSSDHAWRKAGGRSGQYSGAGDESSKPGDHLALPIGKSGLHRLADVLTARPSALPDDVAVPALPGSRANARRRDYAK